MGGGTQAGTTGRWEGLVRDLEWVMEMEGHRQGPRVGDGDAGTQLGTIKWVVGP